MRLPVREQRAQRFEAVEGWINEFRAASGGDELAWVCLPHLIIGLRLNAEGSYPAKPVTRRRAAELIEREMGLPGRETTLAGEHLLFAFSDNQRVAQAPIANLLGAERAAPAARVDEARLNRRLQGAIELVADLIAAAGPELPVRRRWLYRLVMRAARDLARFEDQVAQLRPRSVVVGSTHSSAARALVVAARAAGVPSVYVPHAPAISEARLADLPVDCAALRGTRELDHYEAAGASRDGMETIGNPGVEVPPKPPDPLIGDPVFALPVDDPASLELLVELVREALGDGVVASPHPRTELSEARRALPSAWKIWEGRTFELLRHGPAAVIQASSGTGLESLQLGIPTIELGFPDERPNYPFLEHPEVPVVSTAEDLRSAVEVARAAPDDRRAALQAWAAGWVSASGAAAAKAGAERIVEAAERGPRPRPVWDAWTPAD